jgi:hypothetical protein
MADPERIGEACATTLNYPRVQLLLGVALWLVGTLVSGGYMALAHGTSWYDVFKILFAGFSAGLIASFFSFFLHKGTLRPVAASFQAYRSVETLAGRVTPLGLRPKLLVTFLSLVLVPLIFSGLMIHEKASLALERVAMDFSEPALARVTDSLKGIPPQALDSRPCAGWRRRPSNPGRASRCSTGPAASWPRRGKRR